MFTSKRVLEQKTTKNDMDREHYLYSLMQTYLDEDTPNNGNKEKRDHASKGKDLTRFNNYCREENISTLSFGQFLL